MIHATLQVGPYHLIHAKPSSRAGSTQALASMARSLAGAYVLSLLALVVMVALGRGLLPDLDGFTTFFYANLVGLLTLPASVMFFKGARLSSGRLRKLLAYGMSVATAVLGLGSLSAVILVLLGAARPG